MSNNKRVYYAISAVAADPVDADDKRLGTKIKLQGIQSISIDGNFDYDPVFELGSLKLYGQLNSSNNIAINLSKVIDNKPPLYLLLTQGTQADSNGKNVYDLGSRKSDIYYGVWSDSNNFASGISLKTVLCSGMSVTSAEYNLTSNSLIENIVLEGSSMKTLSDNLLEAQNPQDGSKQPQTNSIMTDNVVVAQRYNIDIENSIFPTGSGGIYGSLEDLRILSINIKCNIDRDKIYELGSMIPAQNAIIFPATIDCSIETLMSDKEFEKFNEYQGNKYIATLVEDQNEHPPTYDIKFPAGGNNWWQSGTTLLGPNGNENICATKIVENTVSKQILIKIKNCNDTSKKTQTDTDDIYFNLGFKNKISTIDYSNTANGDNVIVRYNFKNYSDFSISHTKVSTAGRFTVSTSP